MAFSLQDGVIAIRKLASLDDTNLAHLLSTLQQGDFATTLVEAGNKVPVPAPVQPNVEQRVLKRNRTAEGQHAKVEPGIHSGADYFNYHHGGGAAAAAVPDNHHHHHHHQEQQLHPQQAKQENKRNMVKPEAADIPMALAAGGPQGKAYSELIKDLPEMSVEAVVNHIVDMIEKDEEGPSSSERRAALCAFARKKEEICRGVRESQSTRELVNTIVSNFNSPTIPAAELLPALLRLLIKDKPCPLRVKWIVPVLKSRGMATSGTSEVLFERLITSCKKESKMFCPAFSGDAAEQKKRKNEDGDDTDRRRR